LYECFLNQTYPHKELLILDDTPEPSVFFKNLKDDRVRYIHAWKRLTIGEKRNQLLDQAKGELIAHFDDDDFYAPGYLDFMIKALGKDHAFIKLSGWFGFSKDHNVFTYWDTTYLSSLHFVVQVNQPLSILNAKERLGPDHIDSALWGFGFSYVYKRSLYPDISFDSKDNTEEDFHFFEKVRNAGFSCKIIPDTEGLVLHIIHKSNTSRMAPQFLLPTFLMKKIFPNLFPMK
jgi:glycosyltransferase involved in cell wall biosynthesis